MSLMTLIFSASSIVEIQVHRDDDEGKRASIVTLLIPGLVNRIQSDQVFGLKDSSRRADAQRLDSCDKHRNEER
jgi:hypothetical protein